MKKIIALAFVVSFLFGCSSSDSSQTSSHFVSFKLVDYHNYSDDYDITANWNVAQLINGKYRYTINALVDRDGVDNPNEPHTASPFFIEFEVVQPIQVGQIITIDEITGLSGQFPTNNNPISNNGMPCYNIDQTNQTISMMPEIVQNTTGQVKITNISGNKISGTFYFMNLHNRFYNEVMSGQNFYQYFGCSPTIAPTAPTTMSISNGAFNNIPQQ